MTTASSRHPRFFVSAFGITDNPFSGSSHVGGGIWEEPAVVTVVSAVAVFGSSQTVSADMGAI